MSFDVSVVLVSYNTEHFTRECLKSIYEKTKDISFDIWVVDNNSSDNSCEMIKKEFPQVKLMQENKNWGFGAANNIAIRQSEAKYVFLLNTDTLLRNNAIKILFDYMEQNPDVGACGGNLYSSDDKNVHSYGYFKTFKSKLVRTLKMGKFFPKEQHQLDDKGHNTENLLKEVEVIIGADLMLRKSVLDEVGIFDEDFFLYEEETELQYRIKKAGHKIVINPESKIYHLEGKSGQSIKKHSIVRSYKMVSEILCYKKCYGNKHIALFKLICCLPNFVRILFNPIIMIRTFWHIIFL